MEPGVERSASSQPADAVTVVSSGGTVLALGPIAAAVRAEDGWDSGFGATLLLVYVRDRHRYGGPQRLPMPGAAGIELGGMRLAAWDRGRLWLSGQVATPALKQLMGLAVGASAGGLIEFDGATPPRLGVQGGIWFFAGIVPYVRIGRVQDRGNFADFGIKITLPALRIPAASHQVEAAKKHPL